MEVSLSPELMKILENLVSVFTRVQAQYLVALIPAVGMFLLYFLIIYKPSLKKLRIWWHTRRFASECKGSVIRLAHSSPSSILDMFKLPMITLDDSQKVLQAISDTPEGKPIHLILHTPGGMVIAAEQIARSLKSCNRETHAYVPQYAMSGGTLVALACDKIHLGKNALLGPLDPQLQIGLFDQYPCASLVKALDIANPNRDDRTLVYGDVAKKAIAQMKTTVSEILTDQLGKEKAQELASQLCDGNWTHDYGINIQRARELGLPVDDELPSTVDRISRNLPSESSVVSKKPRKDNGDNRLRITL